MSADSPEEVGEFADVGARIAEALLILRDVGLPQAQQNQRSALTLLALLDLTPERPWSDASAPLRGVTPMMGFMAVHYGKTYKPNTRETVRRQTLHQFVQAGLVLMNPDSPSRPINSPDWVYQADPAFVALVRTFGTGRWEGMLRRYLTTVQTLTQRYASERSMNRIPVRLDDGTAFSLSPGGQNVLVQQVIAEFCPRFTPGAVILHVGDAEDKFVHSDREGLAALGVTVEARGKLPDVIVFDAARGWLVLIEAVTSHGPVDAKRHDELRSLFGSSTAGLVFVTAFLSRKMMVRYLDDIAWETDVWVADAPSHLIHFDGERFLGPYEATRAAR